ncbi:hypothetical protein [Microbacterium enclense]|uniref:hypothetical protein n=1 Tax=Microbacterium enclense TaxID=993073 RepID=UPI000AEA1935|nr:hypothetical protein [Microbacterium enclense]
MVGLFDGADLIGASAAFFAEPAARSMHSHITGILPGYFALSTARHHEIPHAHPTAP